MSKKLVNFAINKAKIPLTRLNVSLVVLKGNT